MVHVKVCKSCEGGCCDFGFGLNFISICFKFILIEYHIQSERKYALNQGWNFKSVFVGKTYAFTISAYSRHVEMQPAIFNQNFWDFSFFPQGCEQKVKLCKLLEKSLFSVTQNCSQSSYTCTWLAYWNSLFLKIWSQGEEMAEFSLYFKCKKDVR